MSVHRVARPLAVNWSAVIPAAGRGTRLKFDRPKILYPVAGRTILEWLIELLDPFCSEFVFVLSPEGRIAVMPNLERLVPGRFRIAIQPEARGMADAILRGLEQATLPNVLLIWGDQVAVKPGSIEQCVSMLEESPEVAGVCPTLFRAAPYIHFVRDGGGRLTEVLQAREGDTMPEFGESDAGVFFFRREALTKFLAPAMLSGALQGSLTKEANFLPVLPIIDRMVGCHLRMPAIMSEAESVGVNTAAEAAYLEHHLRGE